MALYPDIVAAVNSLLPSTVNHADPTSGAEFFGAEDLDAHNAPPRIVWVPTKDSFAPAQQRGSALADARALHTNNAEVDVHCWGGDTAGVLALRDTFIAALRSALGPNYELRGGRWIRSDSATLGRVYILSLAVNIPVTAPATSVATPPLTLPATISVSH